MALTLPTELAQAARGVSSPPDSAPRQPEQPGLIASALAGTGVGSAPPLEPPSPPANPYGFNDVVGQINQSGEQQTIPYTPATGNPFAWIGDYFNQPIDPANPPRALPTNQEMINAAAMGGAGGAVESVLGDVLPAARGLIGGALGAYGADQARQRIASRLPATGAGGMFRTALESAPAQAIAQLGGGYAGYGIGHGRGAPVEPREVQMHAGGGGTPSEPPAQPFEPVSSNLNDVAGSHAMITGETPLLTDLPPGTDPFDLIHAAVERALAAQPAREAANHALRAQQTAIYSDAFERAGGGVAGHHAGLAALKGTKASYESFPPLDEVLHPALKEALYSAVDTAEGLRHWERVTARNALDVMFEEGKYPQPAQVAALIKASPQTVDAMRPIFDQQQVPSIPLLGAAKEGVTTYLKNLRRFPVETLNNTARSTETLLDVAFPGRLAPTAGLYSPKLYAQSVGESFKTSFVKNPQGYIDTIWKSVNADPELRRLGVTVDDMFDGKTGFGLHGAGIDPYSGQAMPGGGMGLYASVPQGQRVQFLNNFNQIFKPQLLREEILNSIKSGRYTPEQIQNDYAVRQALGRSVDLIAGHASWRPFGEDTSLILNFGNWLAAQAEMIARAAVGAGQGALNQTVNRIPGVDVGAFHASPANDAARTALGRLAALSTTLTVGLNAAQGVSPTDRRASRNGVPMLVLNPTGGHGPHISGFKPDTQFDLYGPIGEMIQHAVGIGIAGAKRANEGAIGVALGAGKEAFNYGRSQLAWVPRVLTDVLMGKTNYGEAPSLANEAPVPLNFSGMLEENPRSPGVQAGSALGGRFHEPTVRQQLDYGSVQYGDLSAADQFKTTRHMAWSSVSDMFPADTKGYASYFDWFKATERDYVKQFMASGLPQATAEAQTSKLLAEHPIVKYYTDIHNRYEDQWALDHPAEAVKILDSEASQPWQDKTFRPSKPVFDALSAYPRKH